MHTGDVSHDVLKVQYDMAASPNCNADHCLFRRTRQSGLPILNCDVPPRASAIVWHKVLEVGLNCADEKLYDGLQREFDFYMAP